MNWLDNDLNMEKIFNYSIAIYHRISSIYGVNDNYPPEELEAITIPMISKYLSYEYEKEDLNLVADKIIKRINFFTEEFPFKLYHLYNMIQIGCCYKSSVSTKK